VHGDHHVGGADPQLPPPAAAERLDREVAEFNLSDGFSPEGFEVDVSILFCDVRDFTRFAAEADAQEFISRLNA
jgi:hypothetical protein